MRARGARDRARARRRRRRRRRPGARGLRRGLARQPATGAARRDAPPRLHPVCARAARRAHSLPSSRRAAPCSCCRTWAWIASPVWHYAVVVGFDGDDVILRSGTEQRRIERSSRFLRSWQRGSNWAFVAVEPGELPATATPGAYVRALAGAEPLLDAAAASAATARRSSAGRATSSCCSPRPGNGTAPAISKGPRRSTAELLAAAPQHAAARNNLANVLAERGCHAASARRGARRARRHRADDELAAAVARHRRRDRASRRAESGPAASCRVTHRP